MAQELIYTSASQGLLPGSRGFCTVARTAGLSPVLAGILESRSGYRHLFPPQSDKAGLNPINWVHGTIRLAQTPTHILSRIGDAGLDYTKRSNLIAHHLILRPDELGPGGPAAILSLPNLMQSGWEMSPMEYPQQRQILDPPSNPMSDSLRCVHWEQATGDAGWGGVLAESVLLSRSACILYEPGTDLLPFLVESIALVPEVLRWKITFSTYVREMPPGATFLWKGMLTGTPEAEQARANKGILLIDLTAPDQNKFKPKEGSAFVKIARTGIVPPPVEQESQNAAGPPPVPEKANDGTVPPPLDGGTYEIDESSTKKRKRPYLGTWSSRYESQAVSAEKERKARRIFFTILCFAFLAILVLLTLLGDELFNSGGMRKTVVQSFGGLIQRKNVEPQNGDEPNLLPDSSREEDQPAGKNETIAEPAVPESPTEEELEEQRRQEEEQAAIQQREEEERQAELERLQKEAEEELKRRKAEMRKAFAAIPEAFALLEPREKAFGGVELPKNAQKEFAPLFPYRDYVQIHWIPLVAPKGWRYHLEKVPQVFLDDPHAQWNLIAYYAEGAAESTPESMRRSQKLLSLATLRLGEVGLELEWKPQTAGMESNLAIVNKLPFSYLRFSFGPNEMTESGPGKEKKTLPIPKRFRPADDLEDVDFTKNVWSKDVSLWTPIQNKPFVVSDKGTTITRPSNPVERFDGVFGKDRFRVGLEQLDLQAALLLEVSVRPKSVKNVTTTWEVSDDFWRKTIQFTVEDDTSKNPTITIPIAVEAFADRIEFRDNSRETEAEANKQRTELRRAIPEMTDPQELDAAQRRLAQVDEQRLGIPAARKSVLNAAFTIHYSIYLQGREETEPMLILTTSVP